MHGKNMFIFKNTITNDGLKINYSTSTRDLTKINNYVLVFLHGLGGDLSVWNSYRTFFKKNGYESIALDFRGHGKSEKPKGISNYGYKKQLLDLEAVISKEKITSYILIGHSMGGITAQHYAIEHSESISKMVLISTTPFNRIFANIFPLKYFFILMAPILDKILNYSKPFQYRDHSKFYRTGDFNLYRLFADVYYSNIFAYIFHFEKFDFRNKFGKVQANALVLSGDKDLLLPQKFSLEIHHKLKKSRFENIKGANHIIIFDYETEITQLILRFLNAM